jgi:hypothetical protein
MVITYIHVHSRGHPCAKQSRNEKTDSHTNVGQSANTRFKAVNLVEDILCDGQKDYYEIKYSNTYEGMWKTKGREFLGGLVN